MLFCIQLFLNNFHSHNISQFLADLAANIVRHSALVQISRNSAEFQSLAYSQHYADSALCLATVATTSQANPQGGRSEGDNCIYATAYPSEHFEPQGLKTSSLAVVVMHVSAQIADRHKMHIWRSLKVATLPVQSPRWAVLGSLLHACTLPRAYAVSLRPSSEVGSTGDSLQVLHNACAVNLPGDSHPLVGLHSGLRNLLGDVTQICWFHLQVCELCTWPCLWHSVVPHASLHCIQNFSHVARGTRLSSQACRITAS